LGGWTITGLYASYGDASSSENADFAIQQRNFSNTVVGSINYTHPNGTRQYEQGELSMSVTAGYTLNVAVVGTQPENSAGYSVTLTLELI
jgi:phage gpG-like protein